MSASHLGTIKTLIPGAEITVSRSGVTVTIPKSMSHADALDPTQHPPIGTVLQIMGHQTTLDSFSIVKDDGQLATVNYNYIGTNSGQNVEAVIPENPGPPGFNRNGNAPARYDLDATTEAVSILRHPRFAGITDADRNILARMIQEGVIDADGVDLSLSLSLDPKTLKMSALIKEGIVSYEAAALVWRKTVFNVNWTNVLLPGFIIIPPGPVPDIEGNWILAGFTGTGYEDLAETLTATYKSSIRGDEWDETLFGR